ncbi:MAG: DUF5009 domain-containing protein [Candidatus Hydrogenedentes bacterium]|nr:DUF5009 domain-containing protein [Candidatus Hydrogenedentota bacterium]
MFLMWTELMRFDLLAQAHPGSYFWRIMAYHGVHVPWAGGSLHDLIQPSFAFIVGAALPFSLMARQHKGQSRLRMTAHAFWRAFLLVSIGIFLRSNGAPMTNWIFDDTLTVIGLAYGFLFVIAFGPTWSRWTVFALILIGYWAAFALYPLPGPDFDWARAGTSPDWPHNLTGFAAHWNGNTNLGWAFDTWFLNLFPRPRPFYAHVAGYSTLNFVPTIATMILGLFAGDVLKSGRTARQKVRWLLAYGVAGIALGWVLGALGICPVVKRIWTPSWVLYSGGWCFLFLAAFYFVIDVAKFRTWSFPLTVLGTNAIAAYCMWQLLDSFTKSSLKTHLGQEFFTFLGTANEPLALGAAVLACYWIVLYWMYRRRIFLRV